MPTNPSPMPVPTLDDLRGLSDEALLALAVTMLDQGRGTHDLAASSAGLAALDRITRPKQLPQVPSLRVQLTLDVLGEDEAMALAAQLGDLQVGEQLISEMERRAKGPRRLLPPDEALGLPPLPADPQQSDFMAASRVYEEATLAGVPGGALRLAVVLNAIDYEPQHPDELSDLLGAEGVPLDRRSMIDRLTSRALTSTPLGQLIEQSLFEGASPSPTQVFDALLQHLEVTEDALTASPDHATRHRALAAQVQPFSEPLVIEAARAQPDLSWQRVKGRTIANWRHRSSGTSERREALTTALQMADRGIDHMLLEAASACGDIALQLLADRDFDGSEDALSHAKAHTRSAVARGVEGAAESFAKERVRLAAAVERALIGTSEHSAWYDPEKLQRSAAPGAVTVLRREPRSPLAKKLIDEAASYARTQLDDGNGGAALALARLLLPRNGEFVTEDVKAEDLHFVGMAEGLLMAVQLQAPASPAAQEATEVRGNIAAMRAWNRVMSMEAGADAKTQAIVLEAAAMDEDDPRAALLLAANGRYDDIFDEHPEHSRSLADIAARSAEALASTATSADSGILRGTLQDGVAARPRHISVGRDGEVPNQFTNPVDPERCNDGVTRYERVLDALTAGGAPGQLALAAELSQDLLEMAVAVRRSSVQPDEVQRRLANAAGPALDRLISAADDVDPALATTHDLIRVATAVSHALSSIGHLGPTVASDTQLACLERTSQAMASWESDSDVVRTCRAKVVLAGAKLLHAAGRHHEADECFRAAMRSNPDNLRQVASAWTTAMTDRSALALPTPDRGRPRAHGRRRLTTGGAPIDPAPTSDRGATADRPNAQGPGDTGKGTDPRRARRRDPGHPGGLRP